MTIIQQMTFFQTEKARRWRQLRQLTETYYERAVETNIEMISRYRESRSIAGSLHLLRTELERIAFYELMIGMSSSSSTYILYLIFSKYASTTSKVETVKTLYEYYR